MVHLLIYLQGDLLVCDVIGRYNICVVVLADACQQHRIAITRILQEF